MYNVWHVLRKCIIISRNKKTVMMARYVCYMQYMFMCVCIPGTTEITQVLCNVRKSYVTHFFVSCDHFLLFLLSFVIGSELGV
jgi:hypothetical protein